ncbi:MAG: lyase family protein, partial [Streptosporangiaceae bacterium]
AAGTLSALGGRGPEVAALLAAELGLPAPTLPWHTDRLRITEIAGACAGVTGVLAKIARDVTLLAQSEIGEVAEGGGGRGGSSAMPQKRNPVASIAVLGCTRQVPGLVATLVAAAEQEHQRAAGAWHAEWEPLADLLRLTGSAASWAADLLSGLEPDPGRMRHNLDAAGGFPMAEHLASLLAPALGRTAAHDLLAQASAAAVAEGRTLGEALLDRLDAGRLAEAGVTPGQVTAALDPAGYLGAATEFVDAALAAHTQAAS